MKSKNEEYGFDRYITVFEVEMRAFQEGVIRKVLVPTKELNGDPHHDLERVFYYGQNDFQPVADRCSVSMGDVVRYKGQRWYCSMVGWQQLPNQTYEANVGNVASGKVSPFSECPSCGHRHNQHSPKCRRSQR